MLTKDLQVSLLMIVFSMILIFWLIPTQVEIFSLGTSSEPLLGPRSFPYLISSCICFLGVLQSLICLKSKNIEKKVATVSASARLRVAGVIVISAGYLGLIYLLGYIVPTFIATLLLLLLFGERRWWLTLIISVVTAFLLYTVFGIIFHMMMPQGKYDLFPWF